VIASQNIGVLDCQREEEDLDLEVDVNSEDREKCIRQFVVIAKKSVKYPSDLLRENLFIVTSVG
jgi:hypothetical protein